jgi:hypothetical protein
MLALRKKNRIIPKTQDGRVFKQYKRKWKLERLFAWI